MREGIRVCGLAAAALVMAAGAASAETIYSAIPVNLPGNVSSVGFEASSTSEFGDQVMFRGTARRAQTVRVVMSSWGCQSGHWTTNDCKTKGTATFNHPITLNIYALSGTPGVPGPLLASKTVTFKLRYRPSADPVHCPTAPGKWYDQTNRTCYNGFAQKIEFNLATLNVQLPNDVIWGIAYNTTHYGYTPIGETAACFSTPAGCGYDSLNVGAQTFNPDIIVGTDTDPDVVFVNAKGGYCAGGPTDTFRADSGCWLPYRPLIEFDADKKK